jgi:lipopolysaccharide transport system permease protein
MEDIIESSGRKLFNWNELWRFRELFYFFTWRDIKVKYKQTILGFLWAVLQPLLMMVIFSLFFGKALNIPSGSLPYPLYVISGLIVWNLFSTGLTNACNSMVTNSSIIKKIYFPRLVIPVSAMLVSLFDFCVAFFIFIAVLLYYSQPVSWTALFYWPISMITALLGTLGPGTWMAALNVKYRDIRYVIPFVVQILFFLSPVIYPASILKYPLLKYAVALNPSYAAIELFRMPITHGAPDQMIYISLTSTLIFLLIGMMYFRRTEDQFADFA